MDFRTIMRQRMSLSLDSKIALTRSRVREWYNYWEGMVYVSFSGGKDSTVLLHLVWDMYPSTPAVFSHTGLEYPEIVRFVQDKQRQYPELIHIVRPKVPYTQVIQIEGYPVVSKKTSRALRILREEADNPRWANSYRLYNIGLKRDGTWSKSSKLPDRWRKLIDSDFKISERCCDRLKKEPLLTYQRETGRQPITGMMLSEGGLRSANVTVCNAYDAHYPISSPMLFWTESDVWGYLRRFNVPYCKIYDPYPDGTPGESRTGCMWCMFGVHMEKGENRFQRMKRTHPKQYDYCINKLGLGKVLDTMGIKYR